MRSAPSRPRLMRNAVANVFAFFLAAATAFLISPFVVHRLGDTGYGVWVMLGSMLAYLSILDLGVRSAVTHFTANLHAGSDHEEASRVASTALTVFVAAGTLAFLTAVVLATRVQVLFDLPPAYASEARLVMIVGGATMGVSLIANVYGGVIAGLQRFDALAGVEVAIELLRTAAVFVVLQIAPSLVALAFIQLAAGLGRGAAFYVVARRRYPELKVRVGGGDRAELRRLFAFGVHASLLYFAGVVVSYTHSIIIGVALSATMVTYYAIAANLHAYARSTADAISNAITPRVSALTRHEGAAAAGPIVLNTSRLATLALLPIALTFLLRGDSFIELWMGPGYGEISGEVLSALAISIWALSWRQGVIATMCGLNRHRRLVPYYLGEAALNIALCIWWVQHFGIQGVAWGRVVATVLLSLVVLPLLLQRELGLQPVRVWQQVVARPSLAMIPFAIATALIEVHAPADNLVVFFLQVALTLPGAVAGAWFLGLTAEERGYARERLRSILPLAHRTT